MDKERIPSELRRVASDEARTQGNTDRQYADSEVSSVRAGRGSSDALRAPDTRAVARRGGSRWGDILVGVLTALTTFLLLELLVWGLGLPAGSDRLDTSYGVGPADWVTGFLGVLAFLVGGYVAGMSSALRDRRPGRPGLRAGLQVWLLGTVLILALSALGPEILGGIFGALADVMGTDITADNTGRVVETLRNDALGAFFSLLPWALAAALGGWLGNLTQEQV